MKINQIRQLYSKKDKLHNWNHILKIKRDVQILRKGYSNINEDLLNFLIKFHGLKDYVLKNKNKFDKNLVIVLLRHNKNPKSIEEKLVFDANMLDNTGKEGIRKAIEVGKILGRSKEQTAKYLKKAIRNVRFYTKKGKILGKKKIDVMKKELK